MKKLLVAILFIALCAVSGCVGLQSVNGDPPPPQPIDRTVGRNGGRWARAVAPGRLPRRVPTDWEVDTSEENGTGLYPLKSSGGR